MSKPFFIGIDGGATSCRARIRDMDGSLLGEGESGPANIHSNFRLAMESIRLAYEAALWSAAIGEQSLQHSHAGLGLAGAGIKNACDRLLSQKMPFASTVLETDAYVAWLGAHQGGDGAIVILGTGSCGLAFIKGRRIGVAGWGAEVSDEASGQRMGREALRRTLWTSGDEQRPEGYSPSDLRLLSPARTWERPKRDLEPLAAVSAASPATRIYSHARRASGVGSGKRSRNLITGQFLVR